MTKSSYFKSSNGRISGNIQYSFDNGSWVEQSKMEVEVEDLNHEIRSETYTRSNNKWELVSGIKSIVEKKIIDEEITVTWFYNESQKAYIPNRKSICTCSNGLLEQTIIQDYADGAWLNRSAEGYDYDQDQKISSVYFLTWNVVNFQNSKLYTNII